MKRLKKIGLLLCVCYIVAYILAAGIENFRVKNQYEEEKMLKYEQSYYEKEGF